MTRALRTFVVVVIISACSGEGASHPEDDGGENAVSVSVASPEPVGQGSRILEVAGSVVALRQAPIGFQVGGRIDEVYFDSGDRVKEGEVLAKLRQRDFRIAARESAAAFEAAEAAHEAASISYDLALKQLERARILAEKDTISQADVDQTEILVRKARSGLAEAEAALGTAAAARDRAMAASSDSVLTAPFNAVIAKKLVEKGQMTGPGTPAFYIEHLDRVKVAASIPGSRMRFVDTGADVLVDVSEAGLKNLKARIRALGWTGESAGTFPLELVLENPDYVLRTGMTAWLRIPLRTSEDDADLWSVPFSSVVRRGERTFIFTVDESGKTSETPVQLVEFKGECAVIRADVGQGTRVVTGGQHELEKDSKVRIVPGS